MKNNNNKNTIIFKMFNREITGKQMMIIASVGFVIGLFIGVYIAAIN